MKTSGPGVRWLLILAYLVLLFHLSFEATSSQSGSGKRSIGFFNKRRQPGFFGLITNFVRETVQDAGFVVRNITDSINTEFPPSTSMNQTGASGARRLNISEVNAILGRNYRSLMRLFNTEFRSAIADSKTNIQGYKREFKQAIRPYFTEGAWSSTTTQRTTTSA